MSRRQRPPGTTAVTAVDDAAVRARVRAALAACEAGNPPPFDRLWRNAMRANTSPPRAGRSRALSSLRLALAGVGCFALAVAVYLNLRSAPTAAEADYQLALEVAVAYGRRSPADSLAAGLPESVARGLPSLPAYRYPLLPKEMPL